MAEERLFAALEEIAKENKYKDYHIEITPVTSDGGNFTSTLYYATISAPCFEKLNLFAKVSNLTDEMSKMGGEKNIFVTEFYFYSELSKLFEDLQKKHNVPDEHRFLIPKFYKGNIKLSEELLVLENLSVKGFGSYDRLKPITWEYAAAAVSQLAKFHSLSFAYQQENAEEFAEIIKKFPIMMGDEDMIGIFIGNMLDLSLQVLKKEYKERLKAFFNSQNIIARYIDLIKTNNRKILIHSDFKISNLVHRRKNGKLEVIPVDFQTMSSGNPVSDLLYFIFTGSDGQFRKYYYDNLIEYYYSELTSALRRLNLNIDDIYPKTDFQSDLKQMALHGLMVCVAVVPIVCVDTNNAPDIAEDSNFSKIRIVPSKEYKRRINEAVEDFIRWGLF